MFGSEILDVAIGLIMTFLLVSLVCSSIKEALETVLNHRSKDLERGIREMLGDIHRQGFAPALYKHPLIDGLYKGNYLPGKTGNLPSYIPSRTFALAIIDLLAQTAAKPVANQGDEAQAVDGVQNDLPSLAMFQQAVSALPLGSRLRGSLMPIIAASKSDASKLHYEIERWYDGAMDRVSGWYKKRTQMMLAAIGLGLAVSMNIDTVAMVRYLNTSQTARQVLIIQAEHFRQANATLPSASKDEMELRDPLGWLERQGGVPLGWISAPLPGQSAADFNHDWRRLPQSFSAWLFKVAGLLFTAFAITLGAPFWFDVLNRFMVIRSTVKPDEKSPIEQSKA